MNGKAITGIVCVCLGLIGGYGLALLVGSIATPEPNHRSFAQCIIDEGRGLSKELATVAIVACRELFPTATLSLNPKPPPILEGPVLKLPKRPAE